jgi:predicted GNAT family acetyltransferase
VIAVSLNNPDARRLYERMGYVWRRMTRDMELPG